MSSKNSLLPFLIALASMLLASSGVAASNHNWSKVNSTQLWGCGGEDAAYNLPIQVLAVNPPYYNASALDIGTGEYEQLLKLNNDNNTRCDEFSINACAMSGSENKEALYCVYTNGFSDQCPGGGAVNGLTYQLMRISKGLDGDAFETCVGQLQFDYGTKANAATFDTDGKVMYVARWNYITK